MESTTQDLSSLSDHLLPLLDDEWAVWRRIGLRAAGFPADMVQRLARPECAAAADDWLAAELAYAEACDEALADANSALDELRASGHWDDKSRRAPLVEALQAIKWRRFGEPAEALLGEAKVAGITGSAQRAAELREAFTAEYEAALDRQSEAIFDVASMPAFREAVLWQSHQVFKTAVEKITDKPPGTVKRNDRRRRQEAAVANYLQRYCVKNDTIGFFGPVGWAHFVDSGEVVSCRPGATLLADRNVYFESWCIDAIARAIASGDGVRRWLAPQRLPIVAVIESQVYLPFTDPIPVSPAEAALLLAADGRRAARDIAQEVCADPSSGLDEEAEAYRLFGSFLARGWIDWNFFVPVDPYAREALLEQIESIGEETLRQTCLATFRELDEARAAIAGAAGDVPALDGALARLNESFTRLAGQAATRNEGEAYGGRTLVYEDCLRDLELEIGPEIRREMAEALSVVLPSARWFTHQVTASFRQVATEIYRQMAPSEGAPVPAPLFWEQLQPLFDRRDPRRILGPVLGQLHDRWRELFGLSDSAPTNRLQLSSASLKDASRAAFEAPRAGWEAAINQSPDVMIAARSVEAIRAGDYELVLGEIHVGRNSLNSWVFVSQHPDRQQFFREIDDDLPEPRFWVTRDRNSLGVNTRTSVAWVSPQDYVIPPVDRMFVLPQSQTLPPAALVVVETENGVMLCTRDGQLKFDITKAGSQFISQQLMDSFGFLGAADHLPRVTIDRLTICRESWAFDPETLEFARQKDGAERFLAARRWAREHGLPRYIFVRVPVEAKPFYIDFDSPIYVDILAKSVRATLASEALDKRIRITEMLPTPEQTWLPDADGQRYSSELRIVLKDRTWMDS